MRLLRIHVSEFHYGDIVQTPEISLGTWWWKKLQRTEVLISDSVQVFDRHVPMLLELSSCFCFCLTESVLLYWTSVIIFGTKLLFLVLSGVLFCWASMIICTILVSPSNFDEFVVRVYDSLTGFVYLCCSWLRFSVCVRSRFPARRTTQASSVMPTVRR